MAICSPKQAIWNSIGCNSGAYNNENGRKMKNTTEVLRQEEGDPKIQFHKEKLINSKLFVVIDIVESLIITPKRSLTRLFYS